MRKPIIVAISLFAILLLAADSFAGLKRVPRRYNVTEFYGGLSEPVGSYDRIGPLDPFTDERGRVYDIDATDLYDNTWHAGLTLGQLRNRNMYYGIGFQYTRVKPKNPVVTEEVVWTFLNDPEAHQIDFTATFNYLFTHIESAPIAPFVGITGTAGFTLVKFPGLDNESSLGTSIAVNGGMELKFWKDSQSGAFATFVPQTSYQFLNSGDRPMHWNIGAGLKYYFR